MMKPNNHMALAILTTICCCLPLGIVAIVKASSVDSLYVAKQYTAAMAAAVGRSSAHKILIPVNKCNNIIIGVNDKSTSDLIREAIEKIKEISQE